MFSQLVTAAKGLLHRQQSAEEPVTAAATAAERENRPRRSQIASTTSTANMVTATRRGVIAAAKTIADVGVDGPDAADGNGKRKARPVSAGESDNTTTSKRRKRQSLGDEGRTADNVATVNESEKNGLAGKDVSAAPSGRHMRFGSEEPDLPLEPQPEEESVPLTAPNGDDEDEDGSDDEAPEAIDNSAQLSQIRAEARKQEMAKSM